MKSRTLFAAGVAAIVPLFAILVSGWLSLGETAAVAGLAVGLAFGLRDAQHSVSKALPNGASTVSSDGLDIDQTTNGDVVAPFELEIDAPALATGELGDGATMKYDVYHDTESDFSSEAVLAKEVLVQTGADGSGADAATERLRLPSTANRYVRVKATNSAAGDASGESFTARLVF